MRKLKLALISLELTVEEAEWLVENLREATGWDADTIPSKILDKLLENNT